MTISVKEKKEIVINFGKDEKNTGSTEVQVAILTKKINSLTEHFKINNQILMVIIFSFGLTIEIVHYFHPYRYFEWADLLANFLGIILAAAIHKTLQKT